MRSFSDTNIKPIGWKGAPSAKVVKADRPLRIKVGDKRISSTYFIHVVLFGVTHLFPATKQGTNKMRDKHHCVSPIIV